MGAHAVCRCRPQRFTASVRKRVCASATERIYTRLQPEQPDPTFVERELDRLRRFRGARRVGTIEDALEASLAASAAATPSVEELAALAGVHPTHLLRTFRRHHGATISNYVRQRASNGRARPSRTARSRSR